MSYDIAINKAWEAVLVLHPPRALNIKFLADEYALDCVDKKVLSSACNVPAKDFTAILILHYLAQKLKGLPPVSGEWADFRELSGIEGYGPAFRARSIDPILKKYGTHPQGLVSALTRLPGKQTKEGDVGILLEAFVGVPVLVTLWQGDEEFGPDANMLFDRSISKIFCTEDTVVLAQIIAHQL